jgi:hypothetical protein
LAAKLSRVDAARCDRKSMAANTRPGVLNRWRRGFIHEITTTLAFANDGNLAKYFGRPLRPRGGRLEKFGAVPEIESPNGGKLRTTSETVILQTIANAGCAGFILAKFTVSLEPRRNPFACRGSRRRRT